FEAGTPNFADAVALGATVEYLDSIGMARIREHGVCLVEYALQRLAEVPSLTLFGPRDPHLRTSLIAFVDRDVHPHDLATILDRDGIAIRAGHHCAMPLTRRLGVPATARASFGIYNVKHEVDALVHAIQGAREYLGHAI
ncbi:MAG: aminotransferase class V-fold PLP-dependent enzyme, partial [Acidobacteria bacterium]|nr:aminotransferase class V-fold PLP-dependent enzyme [Acidobacteriota bacterium]